MMEIPSYAVVVMLIDDGDVLFSRFFPSIFIVASFPERSHGADDGNLGMGFPYAVDEEAVAFQEHVADEVFVAYAQVF